MKYLLDTCAFLWLTVTPHKIPIHVITALSDPQNLVYLSSVSGWEISIKYGKGHLWLSAPPHSFVPQKCQEQGIQILPLCLSAALRINELPDIHKDPFDRILVCQALDGDMSLVTADSEIQRYPVKTFW